MIERPAVRYGSPRRSRRARRIVVIGLSVLIVGAGLAVALVGYQRLGSSEVKGELSGYRLVDPHTAEVTISVTRTDPGRQVVCIVRARSIDGRETGRREVLVLPSTSSTVQVTALVKTNQPPVVGDVYGCGTDVPAYLRAP